MLRPCLPSVLPTQCLRHPFVKSCIRHIRPQVSFLHSNIIPRPDKPLVPPPRRTPSIHQLNLTIADIPDIQTFLKRIGRDADKECEDKIRVQTPSPIVPNLQTWRELFKADGEMLKKKEIPARLRRYILMQTEKYRYVFLTDGV